MVMKNFVVFEGIDGAGTSTQINLLKQRAEAEKKFIFSAEPTKKETGVFLRRVLSGEVKARAESAVYLFAADRNEHIFGEDGVKEHTQNGFIEVSDRYFFSSIAYQGMSCGEELPKSVNSAFPLPELLFFFDIDVDEALRRIERRGEEKEIFEKREFLEKIAASYRRIIAEYEQKETGMKIVRIDAQKSADEIAKTIWREISELPILKI